MPVVRSDFAGLWMSLRGLLAQQVGVDVTNHNVANANTEGYSRQVAIFEATRPFGLGPKQGQLGTGVDVGLIQRVRNVFLARQMRNDLSTQGEQATLKDVLQQTEATWNEMTQSGLGGTLDDFWKAWREVANSPDSAAARQELVERSVDLATLFNQTYNRLTDIRQDLDRQVTAAVAQVNDLAGQIGELNQEIIQVRASGAQPNDLADRRDLLIDNLSKLINLTYLEAEDGSVGISVGGSTLVVGDTAFKLQTTIDPATNFTLVSGPGGQPLVGATGSLVTLLRLRDDVTDETGMSIPNQISRVSQLAMAVVTEVNRIHIQGIGLNDVQGPGFTPRNFFTPIAPEEAGRAAGLIAVNDEIRADPSKVGAASAADVEPGSSSPPQDGRIAQQLADLQDLRVMAGNTIKIGDFYTATITQLGVEVQAAKRGSDTQDALVSQLHARVQEQSGVSIDEEATKLVSFQHAYQATARIMNVIDGMLQTVLNVGLVGR